ncbi:hypothetical protein ACOI1C_14075 [Bacillus sp. DJP31]|uniref:hypothetical protein n=1 Tax=Bacillus sp. DJP31 TaxID=3409789 RepID=UPI003BB4E4A6
MLTLDGDDYQMKLEFALKNSNFFFSDIQKEFIKKNIDNDDYWKWLKQDFFSIKLVSMSNYSFIVDVEDTGNRWHKHFVRILCRRGKMDDLCVPYGKNSRELFDVNEI